MKKLVFLSMLVLLFAYSCAPAEKPAEPAPEPAAEAAPEPVAEAAPEPLATAMAVLRNAEGKTVGTAKFEQMEGGVMLIAEVMSVERDGPHGFHVHEVGECLPPDFKAAGGHFNPMGTPHACPPSPERHAGDFGNIEIADGAGRLEIPSELVTVSPGETSVVGKAVILHAGTDDCVGQPTGDAGSRLACGVIELSEAEAEAEGDGGGESGGGES